MPLMRPDNGSAIANEFKKQTTGIAAKKGEFMKKTMIALVLFASAAHANNIETVCQYLRDGETPALKYTVGGSLDGQATYKTTKGKIVDLSNCQKIVFNHSTSTSAVSLCGSKDFSIVAVNIGSEEMAVTGPQGVIELAFQTTELGSSKKSTLFRWSCEYNLSVNEAKALLRKF